MKILWLSNAPWCGSGYGEQTALFIRRLRALGHDVACAANFGLAGAIQQWDGFTIYPADGVWGNAATSTYAKHYQADLVFALCDAWVLEPSKWPELEMAVWAPVDHYPIPPKVLATLSAPNIRPIAMSRFGEQMMRDCKLDPIYIPHGVDTDTFYPRPEIRDDVRDELDIPRDAFLVGMVGANKGTAQLPRKGFPQAFFAFSQLARHRDDAWMYVHTQPKQNSGGGIDLDVLATVAGCPAGRLRFPLDAQWDLHVPPGHVAALYQAFDVLLMPSLGEGFGIPLIEAQACGVPVITSDHSAMSELGREGWLVGGDPWWDALQTSCFIVPNISRIVEALEDAYDRRNDKALRDRAASFAAAFDANAVTIDYWLPALKKLTTPKWSTDELVMDGQTESRQVRRARERKAAKATA